MQHNVSQFNGLQILAAVRWTAISRYARACTSVSWKKTMCYFVVGDSHKHKMCLSLDCTWPNADFGFLQLADSPANLLRCSLALFFSLFFLYQKTNSEEAALAICAACIQLAILYSKGLGLIKSVYQYQALLWAKVNFAAQFMVKRMAKSSSQPI